MPYVFNPFTSSFDYYQSTGVGTQSPNYIQLFDIAAWGLPSGGEYTINVPLINHNKGLNPVVQILEKDGTDYNLIEQPYEITASGTITIKVSEIPDNRFEGKFVISENN